MFLKELRLTNFRNYSDLFLTFPHGRTILYGKNAQGKTNILESIYVLGLTKSHRSNIDQSLIQQETDFTRIDGIFELGNFDTTFELTLQEKSKRLKVDGSIIKKVGDYVSKVNIIIFYPEDLELMKGSPNTRRRYFNLELSQLNSTYLNVLNDYHKLLKMRNDYLKDTILFDDTYYQILTRYFIEKAIFLYRMRKKFVDRINEYIGTYFFKIAGMEGLELRYEPGLAISSYTKEEIESLLYEKFHHLKEAERSSKTTLFGPHRDDYSFYLSTMNLKEYGSQGQQRMAILALKLSEIPIFKQHTSEYPVLLLDDVFSELDESKRNNLLACLPEEIQTIITTTDLTNLDSTLLKTSKLVEIESGSIISMKEVQ